MTPFQAEDLAELRRSEVEYRRNGQFEAAVQSQMAADTYEASPNIWPPMCSWFQRGRDRRPYFKQQDGLLGIRLPNGLIYWMTEDVCDDLLGILLDHRKISPGVLRATADQIEQEQWLSSSRVSKQKAKGK